MGTSMLNAGGNGTMDYHPIQGGIEIFPMALCYRNWSLRAGHMCIKVERGRFFLEVIVKMV